MRAHSGGADSVFQRRQQALVFLVFFLGGGGQSFFKLLLIGLKGGTGDLELSPVVDYLWRAGVMREDPLLGTLIAITVQWCTSDIMLGIMLACFFKTL